MLARLGTELDFVVVVVGTGAGTGGTGGATGGATGGGAAVGGAEAVRAGTAAGVGARGLVELGRLVHASSSNPLAEVNAELLRGGRSNSIKLLAADGVMTVGDDVLAIWSEALLMTARSTP